MPRSKRGAAEPRAPKRRPDRHERGPKWIRVLDIVAALRKHRGVVSAAARDLDCSHENIRQRINKSPELKKLQLEIVEDTIDLCEEKLFGLIEGADFRAIQLYLKTRGKHRGYTEKVEVDQTEPTGKIVLVLPKRAPLPED